MAESHNLGENGEEQAAKYLKDKGYRILHRNWVSGKREIDIVASISGFVVFVEVKTRSEDFRVSPRESVTREKQRSVLYAAENYIKRYNIDSESRFDVITVISKKGGTFEIEHIENAFYPTLR